MSEATVRHRNSKGASTVPTTSADEAPDEIEDAGPIISVLDVVRVLFTLCAASCALSYYLTAGNSVLWGFRPWPTRPQLLKAYLKGPINLTPSQLSTYDGTNPELPIYLAINGTVFDVTAGRHTYGPGGSYSVFAGKDATRAFVTGCFLEDKTDDMRGAEMIYVPVEDEDDGLSGSEKKLRAEKERRDAKKRVQQEVQKWEDFYKKSKKYFEVGKVVGKDNHEGPVPELCEMAEKGRPKRSKMKKKWNTNKAEGKPVQ